MNKKTIAKIVYILIICMLVSSFVLSASSVTVNEGYFNGMFEFIDMLYRKDIGVENIMGTSLNGVMEGMSEYSCFELIGQISEKSHYGIGANLEKVRRGFMIVSVMPASPAFKAGLCAGDTIYRVDKQNTSVMSIASLKGYLANNESVLVEVIVKKTGRVKAVRVDTLPDYKKDVDYVILDNAGYIRLNAFSDTTYDVVKGILNSLSVLGVKNIILDLRSLVSMNIEDAAAVAGLLSEGGTIVRTKSGTYNVKKKDMEFDVKILINELTAGAGEVIAAAVPSVLYGQTTAGEANHIVRYPVFSEEAYNRFRNKYKTDNVQNLINILKAKKDGIETTDIIGYLNIVESGVYNKKGKLISDSARIEPDVAVADTSIGYMDYTPGEGMIEVYRDYMKGSVNYDVFLAKKILSMLGYFDGAMTVVFGDDMVKAVNNYKKSMGFSEDGVLDMSIQAMLNTYSMKTVVLNDSCVHAAIEDIN